MYCSNCGKEVVNENQAICLGCGCLLSNKKNNSKALNSEEEKKSSDDKIIYASKVLIGTAFLLILVGIIMAVIYLSSGYLYKYTSTLTYLNYDYTWAVLSILFVGVSFPLGIIGSIILLVKNKIISKNEKLFAIFSLVAIVLSNSLIPLIMAVN